MTQHIFSGSQKQIVNMADTTLPQGLAKKQDVRL